MRYVQNKQIAWRKVEGEAILVLTRSSEVKVLNDVGTRAWELWEEPRTVREGAESVAEEYEVDVDQAEKDFAEFAESMVGKGLLMAIGE